MIILLHLALEEREERLTVNARVFFCREHKVRCWEITVCCTEVGILHKAVSSMCHNNSVQSKICNVGADSGGEWGSEGLRHASMEFWAFSDTSKLPPPLRLKGIALKNTLENWQSTETIKKYSLYYTLNVFNNLSSLSGKKMKNTEELQDCLFKICFLLPLDVCAFVIE